MISFFAQFIDKPPSLPTTSADSTTIESFLTIVFGIFGALAFLVIVLAAFQYTVSSGDPNKTARARNTIVYAAVGLAISAGAVFIIQFVLGRV